MLVRVLGEVALEAADRSEVPLPGSRLPALLAALVARRGEVVGPDRLADLVWGGDQPVNPTAALHSAVFKLRDRLSQAGAVDVLVRRGSGYVLDVPGYPLRRGFTFLAPEHVPETHEAEAPRYLYNAHWPDADRPPVLVLVVDSPADTDRLRATGGLVDVLTAAGEDVLVATVPATDPVALRTSREAL